MKMFIRLLACLLGLSLSLQGAYSQSNVPKPGGNPPKPGGGVPTPGSNVPQPGGNVPKPGGAVPSPAGTIPQPGGNLPRPGNIIPLPGSTLSQPGALVPGNTTPQPGGAVLFPLAGQTLPTVGNSSQTAGAPNANVGSPLTGNALQTTSGNSLPSANPGTVNQFGQNIPTQPSLSSINQNIWFMNRDIQEQLNLNVHQANLLNQQYLRQYDFYNRQLAQTNGSKNLTDAQKLLQLQLSNRFYADLGNAMNQIFDDAQRARFSQLSLQYQGYQAFNDPTIAQRLQLTADQVSKFRTLEQQYNQQLESINKLRPTDPTIDPSLYAARFVELRQDMLGKINSVLSPEQQAIWKTLIGDPYIFRVESWLQ